MDLDNWKFIYAFDTKSRDTLLSYGFELIQSNEIDNRFIFLNNAKTKFSALPDLPFAFTNTLYF